MSYQYTPLPKSFHSTLVKLYPERVEPESQPTAVSQELCVQPCSRTTSCGNEGKVMEAKCTQIRALLKNLHFHLCQFKLGKTEHKQPIYNSKLKYTTEC